MEETTFLNEGGVTVTNARFIVPAQTSAMSGVTSVRAFEERPRRIWPGILIAVGAMALFARLSGDRSALIPGIVFLAAGILWWLAQKSSYHVILRSASGESRALSSKDGNWVTRVVNALNEAIVARG